MFEIQAKHIDILGVSIFTSFICMHVLLACMYEHHVGA